jgi:electron transport complex protein RnfA
MGGAVVFVMTMATALTWPIQHLLLVPHGVEYLQTIVFILVIASLVQLVEMVLRKFVPPLYASLGIYLPLITTNCAVLGVAIINISEGYDFFDTLVFSFASALGYSLALILFAGIRERLALANVPKVFEGTAIALVTAGFLALAFSGFAGLV